MYYSNTDVVSNIGEFDWGIVLSQSDKLIKNPYNSTVYTLESVANIAAYRKYLCIHPGGKEVEKTVLSTLSEIVSEYYNKRIVVTAGENHTYKVEMENTNK